MPTLVQIETRADTVPSSGESSFSTKWLLYGEAKRLQGTSIPLRILVWKPSLPTPKITVAPSISAGGRPGPYLMYGFRCGNLVWPDDILGSSVANSAGWRRSDGLDVDSARPLGRRALRLLAQELLR